MALTGALGVFCSVMLYQSTRRRYWNGPATSFKFALTSVMLGLAFSTAAAAIVLALTHADPLPLLEPWLDFAWPMLAAATVLKLAGELAVIRHLRAAGAGDLKRSARLLVGELGSLLGLRTGLALLGGVILPAAFFGASGDVPFVAQLTVALLSAALLLPAEKKHAEQCGLPFREVGKFVFERMFALRHAGAGLVHENGELFIA